MKSSTSFRTASLSLVITPAGARRCGALRGEFFLEVTLTIHIDEIYLNLCMTLWTRDRFLAHHPGTFKSVKRQGLLSTPKLLSELTGMMKVFENAIELWQCFVEMGSKVLQYRTGWDTKAVFCTPSWVQHARPSDEEWQAKRRP